MMTSIPMRPFILRFCIPAFFMLAMPLGARAVFLSGIGGAPSDPAMFGGQVVTFDSVAPGLYGALSQGNVKFIGVGAPFAIDNFYINQFNTTGSYYIQSGTVTPPITPVQYQFAFTNPVAAFAFNYGAADNSWKLQAYDVNNNLLESDTILVPYPGSNNGEYFGIALPTLNIKYAILIDQLDNYATGDHVFIDNFTSTQEIVVPEPACAGLAIVALAGLCRRKT